MPMPNSIIINGIAPPMTAAVDELMSLTMVDGIVIQSLSFWK